MGSIILITRLKGIFTIQWPLFVKSLLEFGLWMHAVWNLQRSRIRRLSDLLPPRIRNSWQYTPSRKYRIGVRYRPRNRRILVAQLSSVGRIEVHIAEGNLPRPCSHSIASLCSYEFEHVSTYVPTA